MIERVLMLVILFFHMGCTGLGVNLDNELKEDRLLSCEKKAKAKSLQFLEHQYRCTSN